MSGRAFVARYSPWRTLLGIAGPVSDRRFVELRAAVARFAPARLTSPDVPR